MTLDGVDTSFVGLDFSMAFEAPFQSVANCGVRGSISPVTQICQAKRRKATIML
jgi:hypothetical protein